MVLPSINVESNGDLSDAQKAEEVESRARSRVAELSQRPFDVGNRIELRLPLCIREPARAPKLIELVAMVAAPRRIEADLRVGRVHHAARALLVSGHG